MPTRHAPAHAHHPSVTQDGQLNTSSRDTPHCKSVRTDITPSAAQRPSAKPASYPPGHIAATMITDNELYQIAIILGSAAMVLIVVYHFLEVNTLESEPADAKKASVSRTGAQPAKVAPR
ncbi:hypothetical protein GGTG_10839 [Gaeumannomyces tritici R3-111a-1]|uniref:Dolichyl-diphosphooligosaccharide--protein glycosyltransferase subunit 4 n=1 Tax=Gaeumannomyces tritici (strain R3-111a-1) TaxID=644352 RepID=J3PBG6_GAET3|nr:hypothetical protein GGTG_10839 [Gaeumannomyces tritici R3-111a-1]EJT71583.1 hypothetical protein GGTG_10839 [Gaeumannomyces tritici R3-111a-1]